VRIIRQFRRISQYEPVSYDRLKAQGPTATAHNERMPSTDDLRRLGQEIDRERIAAGIPTLKELARRADLSHQRVSEIINAYVHPSRGPTMPSDDTLHRLAEALGVPVSRYHALLGRLPDVPFPVFQNPEAVEVAEIYDSLSPHLRAFLYKTVRNLQEADREMSKES